MVKKYRLFWTKRSQQHLRAAFKYISEDSPKNAKKVVEEIILSVEKTISNPQFYGPDKYKICSENHRFCPSHIPWLKT